jgi:hypothetical protein
MLTQRKFHWKFVDVFIIRDRTKFNMPNSSGSLLTDIKWRNKYRFHTVATLVLRKTWPRQQFHISLRFISTPNVALTSDSAGLANSLMLKSALNIGQILTSVVRNTRIQNRNTIYGIPILAYDPIHLWNSRTDKTVECMYKNLSGESAQPWSLQTRSSLHDTPSWKWNIKFPETSEDESWVQIRFHMFLYTLISLKRELISSCLP